MTIGRTTKPIHRTKSELIAEELKILIVNGHFAPGQRLILREVAREFGCSGIPVREALNSLSALGLVTIVPHEGARVSQFDLRELLEMTEIRLVLEYAATLKAAASLDAGTLSRLEDLVSLMERAVSSKDARAYSDLNRQFHETIFEHCPNAKMIATIHSMRERTQRGRAVHRLVPTHNQQSFRLHRQIIEAIASKDLEKLDTALKEHNNNALRAMERLTDGR